MSEVNDKIVITPDRVSCFIKRSINVAKYETLEISLGYSSDRSSEETTDDCFDRVVNRVKKEYEEVLTAIGDGKIKIGVDNNG